MGDFSETRFADWKQEAARLDATDPLAGCKMRFAQPAGGIYLDGNSLGLLSNPARERVQRVLEQWGSEAIAAWKPDGWFDAAERLGERVGKLVGAQPGETIVTGSTTANLHQLLATFFQPKGSRRRILADAAAFPSDLHAIRSHLRLRGLEDDISLVFPNNGGLLESETVLTKMDETVSVAVLPAVVYTTGQLLDLRRITTEARRRGVLVLWDCSHSIGAVPHRFVEDRIDLAFWCSYKYLNGGPGAVGGLYVGERLHGFAPGMAGWWGGRKETMFAMSGKHEPADGAAGLQIGTPHLLSMAALEGSLELFEAAGMEAIRRKSLMLTRFLRCLAEEFLPAWKIVTPHENERRGGHLALCHPAARALCSWLRQTNQVTGDFRPPDLLRLAPVAFYNSFHELVQAVQAICEGLEQGAHLAAAANDSLVT